jgi:hypothetical protein
MDCRIQVLQEDDVRVVRVAGCLRDVHVQDLLMACSAASGPLRIDLTDVVSAEAAALEAIGRVRDAGAELVGVPRYLLFKLESPARTP